MIVSSNKFTKSIAAWAQKTEEVLDANVRAITFKLFSGIIMATPVDPGGGYTERVGGLARGNWQTTTGSPAVGTIERIDPTGSLAIQEVLARQGGAGKRTYLTNDLPQIDVLEYGLFPLPVKKGTRLKGGGYEIRSEEGFSRQAPAGMVRVTMARISEIVRDAKPKV